MPAQRESDSALRDSLLALPPWTALAAVGLLGVGVGAGFVLLLVPHLSDALRGAGGQLLLITLPVLAISVVVVAASRASTKRIDSMVATYVRETIGDKLEAYLVPRKHESEISRRLPPLFDSIERHFAKEITSFCEYWLFDKHGRRFDILVKSNVFNIEICLVLDLKSAPPAAGDTAPHMSYSIDSLDEWSSARANPFLGLVSETVHGSLSEGYTVYIEAIDMPDGGISVTYRFRQKLNENFLTSPYLRRYFSEDAAIATYFFFAQAFANAGNLITGGSFADETNAAGPPPALRVAEL